MTIRSTTGWRRLAMIGVASVVSAVGAAAWVAGCVVDGARAEPASPTDPLPPENASQAFWDAWSDGRGEVAAYRVTTPRYGELREGTVVLVYALEEHDARTWIKDDRGQVPDEHRTVVMKLNELLTFRTGMYPYRVMTSTFAPVNGTGRERFAPTRIVFSSQEWCGLVYHRVVPSFAHFEEEIRSYFSAEGEASRRVETEPFTLYENALLVQLRELDGAFAGGGDWSGQLVPALWRRRRSHHSLEPVNATIDRSVVTPESGVEVTRFVLRYDDFERIFDVERSEPRRVLRWTTSEGERAELLGSERLPYWQLHDVGDESFLRRVGLDERGEPLGDDDGARDTPEG